MRHRYIFVDGDLVEVTPDYRPEPRKTSWQSMPDITPYRSMLNGKVINSRSTHREHLRDHGCFEVGNDSSLHREPKPIASPPGLKQALIRAADECLKRK